MKKGWAYTKMSLNAILVVPFALMAFLLLFLTVYFPEHGFSLICWTVVDILGLGFTSWLCVDSVRKAHQEAKRIPYTPPVTAETLPAEEVLLRSSQLSGQEQSQSLLRGAENSQDTVEQELVRGSQVQE